MIKPGFYEDLPAHEYHVDSAMSNGKLKVLQQSPAHYLASLTANKPTKEMVFGSAVHTAVLEPHLTGKLVDVAKRVTPADREEAAGAGVSLITEEENEHLKGMCQSINTSATARNLIAGASNIEASVFWKDATYDFMCKCKPDILRPDLGIVADLKTCADGTPSGFAKASANYGYDIQAAWYLVGCNTINPEWRFRHFVFICIEKKPPYAVSVYRADDNYFVQPGREKIRSLIATYNECLKTGVYPSYPDTIQDLQLPAWAQ